MQIGFKALEARFGIMPVQPLRVASVIGTARAMRESPGCREPVSGCLPAGRYLCRALRFGLKYEEIHLEFFTRLFAVCGPQPLEDGAAPSRSDSTRVGLAFYEWLTGNRLDVPDQPVGPTSMPSPMMSI